MASRANGSRFYVEEAWIRGLFEGVVRSRQSKLSGSARSFLIGPRCHSAFVDCAIIRVWLFLLLVLPVAAQTVENEPWPGRPLMMWWPQERCESARGALLPRLARSQQSVGSFDALAGQGRLRGGVL